LLLPTTGWSSADLTNHQIRRSREEGEQSNQERAFDSGRMREKREREREKVGIFVCYVARSHSELRATLLGFDQRMARNGNPKVTNRNAATLTPHTISLVWK
jgi:hypothetical protein